MLNPYSNKQRAVTTPRAAGDQFTATVKARRARVGAQAVPGYQSPRYYGKRHPPLLHARALTLHDIAINRGPGSADGYHTIAAATATATRCSAEATGEG
jgi:hypothetical protein